jgi:molecular chaperone DnaK (HSP70)
MGGRENARLRLLSVDLLPPEPYKEAGVQCLTPLPLDIAGSDKTTVEFQLNLQAFSPKIHHFSLVVTANRRELNRTYTVPLQVRALQPFNGIAAIDFGTSNTCFALLPTGGDLEMVPIDELKTTAPTLVRYLDLSGTEPRIQTGSRIKELAAVEEKVASSTLSRLKQLLGEGSFPLPVRPANSSLWVTREARQAAADYLRHIRSVGEKLHGVLFTEFILTHPAVCSLQQYRNLRMALEDAFGKNSKIHFLQEPIASLVPFFKEISENGTKSSFTVAAFDLGGGTTDITVVAVEQTIGDALPRKISPEIIASWGEKFGGEDITDFLVGEVKRRCQQLLVAEHPDCKLADTGVSGSPQTSIRRNESALREWVEEFKASISEERGAPELRASLFLSVVPDDRNQPPKTLELNTNEIRARGDSLENVLSHYLAGRLKKLATRLKDSIKDLSGLNYIHLSGKTSFLKEVRRVLEEQFPEAEIKRATDPKECVVRGACMWRSLKRGRTVRLILPSSIRRTTSQIGVLDEMGNFVAGLRLDQEIPDTGLEGTLSGAWDGQDRIVLWENLGVENRRFSSDGSLSPLITMLGTWEAATAVPPEVESWDLRLRLQADFTLQVAAVSGERRIECRPFGLRGDQ